MNVKSAPLALASLQSVGLKKEDRGCSVCLGGKECQCGDREEVQSPVDGTIECLKEQRSESRKGPPMFLYKQRIFRNFELLKTKGFPFKVKIRAVWH